MANPSEALPQARVAILGGDAEGLAVLAHLQGQGLSDITICDANEGLSLPVDVARRTGRDWLAGLSEFGIIYRGSLLRRDHAALTAAEAAGSLITSATREFLHYCPSTVIGVTGSNGKTVTTELIAAILRTSYFENVHVGSDATEPLLAQLERIERDHVAVVELSSSQLQDVTRSPHLAVVLNLTPRSYGQHADFESYVEATTEIVRNQDESGYAVLNWSYERVREMQARTSAQTVFFHRAGDGDGAFESQGHIILRRRGRDHRLSSVADLPPHLSIDSVLAGSAVGVLFDLGVRPIREAIRRFPALRHRMQLIREVKGVRFFDDAAATTQEAALHAVHCFPEKRAILITSAEDFSSDLELAAKELVRSRARCVILGAARHALVAAVEAAAGKLRVASIVDGADSIGEGVGVARAAAEAGDVVVFSPGSDVQHKRDVSERGLAFQRAVAAIEA